LAAAATLTIPLPLMRLSTPVALTAVVSFIFVAEASPVVLAAKVSFPPRLFGPNRWPLELCYGPLKYCHWRLGNRDSCPGEGARWQWKANHRARAYIKGGRGGGPPYPCVAFTLTLTLTLVLRILPTAWPIAFALMCILRPVPFSLPSPLAFFGGGFSLSFLHSSLSRLLRSLAPSPWH
jgi:hypothetical protein